LATLHVEELTTVPGDVVLRPEDEAECRLLGADALQAIMTSAMNSMQRFVVMHGDVPVAYWGWAPTSVTGRECWAWMLTTPEVDRIPVSFGRKTMLEFLGLLDCYSTINVLVDPRYTKAVKWLTWLGFQPVVEDKGLVQMRVEKQ
jgi:hypothetical protein